jgi:hypothetical protein
MRKRFQLLIVAGLMLGTLMAGTGEAMSEKKEIQPYGKAVTYHAHTPLIFADFTLTALDAEDYNAPNGPTVSRHTEKFALQDSSAQPQTLKVTSGQLPPQPLDFESGGQKFTLYTYTLPDNKTRLEREQLAVFRK